MHTGPAAALASTSTPAPRRERPQTIAAGHRDQELATVAARPRRVTAGHQRKRHGTTRAEGSTEPDPGEEEHRIVLTRSPEKI